MVVRLLTKAMGVVHALPKCEACSRLATKVVNTGSGHGSGHDCMSCDDCARMSFGRELPYADEVRAYVVVAREFIGIEASSKP